MSVKQSSGYCVHCEKRVLTTGTAPNHLLHFFLSLFTAGLWLVIWILIAVGKSGNYRCSRCGSPV